MCTRQSVILIIGLVIAVVANEQNECQTPHLHKGQCVPLKECTGLLTFLTARSATGLLYSEHQYVIKSRCLTNYGHVCCNNDDPFWHTQAATQQTYIEQTQSTIGGMGNIFPDPSQYQCGRPTFRDRIIGGKDTQLGEFPWMALLEYENSLGIRKFACGGSLINSRYVLTAAHCLVGPIEKSVGKLIIVRLGEHNVDTKEDCVVDNGEDICSDPVQDISVESTIPHPDYVPNDRNQYHDIGLVRLRQIVTNTEYIHPICLPSAHLRSEPGHKLVVAGWGITITGKNSPVKQQVPVPVVDQQNCHNLFSLIILKDNGTIQIQDKQLCAGGELNRDSCNGDSGGPLMSLSNNLWHAEGVVSYGLTGCGKVGWPGIYTRVTQYLDWIRSNVNP